MATPTIPKKEKASELLKLRRKAVKLGREASTRFSKSLKSAQSNRLLQQLTKGKTNLPRIPGSVAGAPLLNRTLRPLSSGLIGRAGLAIQGIQTARSVFDKDDNIITSLRNINRVARGQEALGNSAVAQAYNKRRALKIDQSLEQIYKDAPMSNKVVKYGSSVDADAIQEAKDTLQKVPEAQNLSQPIQTQDPPKPDETPIRKIPVNDQGQITSISENKLANLDDRSNYSAIEWAGKNQSSARNSIARQRYLKRRKALEIGAKGG